MQSWNVYYEDRPAVLRTVESKNALDAVKDYALQVPRGDDCAVIVAAKLTPEETSCFERRSGIFALRPPGAKAAVGPEARAAAERSRNWWVPAALVTALLVLAAAIYLVLPWVSLPGLTSGGRAAAPRTPSEAYHLAYVETKYPGIFKPAEESKVSELEKLAGEGNPVAQNMLGNAAAAGRGGAKDYARAAKWYRQAADQGYAPAQNNLGWLYLEGGWGVSKDEAEALNWMHKAADQGYAIAQANLAWVYEGGRGVNQDEARAYTWKRKAAESGYAPGEYNLGVAFERGDGVPKDEAQAAAWYLKAAEQGFAPAQEALASLYQEGRGVPKNPAEVLVWRRKAAAQGHGTALYQLGRMYAEGDGVAADKAKAAEFYKKAADQGNEQALGALSSEP